MKKPNKCCPIGSYEHQVPMSINGRSRSIDLCIADIVAALNAANIVTVASCCGHSIMPGSIILDDGREIIVVKNPEERNEVFKIMKRKYAKPPNFYKKKKKR